MAGEKKANMADSGETWRSMCDAEGFGVLRSTASEEEIFVCEMSKWKLLTDESESQYFVVEEFDTLHKLNAWRHARSGEFMKLANDNGQVNACVLEVAILWCFVWHSTLFLVFCSHAITLFVKVNHHTLLSGWSLLNKFWKPLIGVCSNAWNMFSHI